MIIPYQTDVEIRRMPVVCMLLITVNVVVHAVVEFLDPTVQQLFYYDWGFVPFDYAGLNFVTSMFLHGGLGHLAGNMLFFWVFGPAVEDRIGHTLFLPAYLVFGVMAVFVHSVTTPDGLKDIPCIGASGAISGLMGAFLVMYPKGMVRSIVLFFIRTPLPLPAWIFLGMWFLEQAVLALYASDYVNVGVFAHIGGFLCGAFCGLIFPHGDKSPKVARAMEGDSAKVDPRTRYYELKTAVEKDPNDLQLRYALALAAGGAGETAVALEQTKYIYHRLPEHEVKRRFNIKLLEIALGQSDNTAKGLLELAEVFYLRRHCNHAYPLYLRVAEGWPDHPRRPMILVRIGEMLAEHYKRPEEAVPWLEEAARGDPRSGLVQEANFLLKKISKGG